MLGSFTRIDVERLAGNRSVHPQEDNLALSTLTSTNEKRIEYRYEASAATLCFIRGTGKISIGGSQIE